MLIDESIEALAGGTCTVSGAASCMQHCVTEHCWGPVQLTEHSSPRRSTTGESLVGRRIEVWWHEPGDFFAGVVEAFQPASVLPTLPASLLQSIHSVYMLLFDFADVRIMSGSWQQMGPVGFASLIDTQS